MAKAYHEKKLTTKLLEGAVGGLAGGAVAAVVLMVIDAVTRAGNSFWHTISAFGSLLTGGGTNGTPPLGAAFFIGLVALLLFFALIGMGLTSYLPIIRRLGWSAILLGAVYGVLIWLLVPFLLFNFLNPSMGATVSTWALLIASVVGCAVIGWWLDMMESRSQSQSESQTS